MKYINIPEDEITFAVPPKCGSSAVYHALEKHFECAPLADCPRVRLLDADVVPAVHKLVFVVRHPVARFRSLWRNKCRDGGKVAGFGTQLHGLTPEELFEFITTHENAHWATQISLLPAGIDTVWLTPAEKLCLAWTFLTDYPPLDKRNATNPSNAPELTQVLSDKILDRYEGDLLLWYDAWREDYVRQR